MSTEAISPLRQRMIEDMNSRKLGAHTQRSHIYSCKRFAAFLERSPDTATLEDIRLFQLHLAETGTSICNRNRIMTGVRFLLRVTLRRLGIYPGIAMEGWFVLLGPAGMPDDIVHKINRTSDAFLKEPETQKRWISLGSTTHGAKSPAEVGDFLRSGTARWGKVFSSLGVQPE